MQIAPRSELQVLVRDFLAASGFDSKAASLIEAAPRYWARPPLTTTLSLAGNPLMPHLASPCERGADLFADVYERFIAGYVRRRMYRQVSSPQWFRQELRMSFPQARMLFTEPGIDAIRLNSHLNLVQFAALVYYNTDCVLDEGASTFAVKTIHENLVFGVRDGQLLTNLNRGLAPLPVRFLHSPTGRLQDIARGGSDWEGEVTMLDTLAHWADSKKERLGTDYDSFQLALRILWWRGGRRTIAPVSELLLQETSAEAWDIALTHARKYEDYARPLEALRGILVPQFISAKRFTQLFGSWRSDKGKIPDVVKWRWDEALNELEASVVVPAD